MNVEITPPDAVDDGNTLTLDAIAGLHEGDVRKKFDLFVRQLRDDIFTRPEVRGSRGITLALTLSPKLDKDGELEGVEIATDVVPRVPKSKSMKSRASITRRGFRLEDDPEEPELPFEERGDEGDEDEQDDDGLIGSEDLRAALQGASDEREESE